MVSLDSIVSFWKEGCQNRCPALPTLKGEYIPFSQLDLVSYF